MLSFFSPLHLTTFLLGTGGVGSAQIGVELDSTQHLRVSIAAIVQDIGPQTTEKVIEDTRDKIVEKKLRRTDDS
jgi:hypothetical protein